MSEAPGSSRTIFLIRHGEKPGDPPPPNGADVDGNPNDHSLAPVGWQRAGGLVGLFAPFDRALRKGILTPTELFSPGYGTPTKTAGARTHETIFPISQLLDLQIDNTYVESESHSNEPPHPTAPSEAQLGAAVAAEMSGVTLICWEHTAIHEIANAIVPVACGTVIPQSWPDDRFDVVWSFSRSAGSGDPYVFSQIPEMLIFGDQDTPIPT